MKKITWRRHHKWLGLGFAIFMVLICISGVILNHRHTYANVNVSRSWLPERYKFSNWNNGLLRGTLRLDSTNVAIYGAGGIFLSRDGGITDYNRGLPTGADHRQIRAMAVTPDSTVFAAGQFGIYRLDEDRWQEVKLPQEAERERISDMAVKGDSLVVVGRSRIYLSRAPYTSFSTIELDTPDDFTGKVSLFRYVWLLHSGEFFGLPGKVVADLVAIVLIFLTLTGIATWLLPKWLRRRKAKGQIAEAQVKVLRGNNRWHRKIGLWTLVVLLFVAVTGWMLRPPLLIPLVLTDAPGIPHTHTTPDRPWADKLRMMQYDPEADDWLLCTSDGFYSVPASLEGTPRRISFAPAVSVMGPNVLCLDNNGCWLVGSFSGLTVWHRPTGMALDWHSGEAVGYSAGPPFGARPISGYSGDFGSQIVVDYNEGTPMLNQPAELAELPMSLWNLALEVHTGRIYGLWGAAPLIWVFIAGAVAIWILVSGYKIARRKAKRQSS